MLLPQNDKIVTSLFKRIGTGNNVSSKHLTTYKSLGFFYHLCDTIIDVTRFKCFDVILGCDIFGKKKFDSMQLPSLVTIYDMI